MSGQPGPWFVQVRTASGTVVAMGLTGASGDISLGLPLGPGLVLDVIGTDAVDVPVAAGQSVLVLIN